MLMVVDVGNTNIVIGLFHEDDLVMDWRLYTDPRRTDDEYSSIVRSLFRDSGIAPGAIETSVVSSVVPQLNETFTRMIKKLTGRCPHVLAPAVYHLLPVSVPASAMHEIGADILCAAVAAWDYCKKSCIVVDFGTALTFTAIGPNADICGVAIAPGLGTAVRSLFRDTAQLPSIPLEVPPSSLGTNTIHAIQAGVVLGYQGLLESLIARMRSDLGENVPVIATGGLSSVLDSVTESFDHIDSLLTLRGLKIIAGLI